MKLLLSNACLPTFAFQQYYDPLGFAGLQIYDQGADASIAFLRHSEIKHGRIAMAAFVGYIVHANGIKFPWPMTLDGTPFPSGSPPEIWDALPYAAKFQIIFFIGFLELWSEMAGTHYMRGGQPGKFPNFSDYPDLIPHPALSLYDPFGFHKNKSDAAKERGLISELNNGRLAQIGILGFLAEQKVAGSVPLLSQIGDFPYYAGEPMAPF
jgi:Chlorophyll A-B binding protein